MDQVRGLGRALFAAVLLMLGGVLNIIYGIAAIGKSSFFVQDVHYVFGDLKTWGWVTLIIGIIGIIDSGDVRRPARPPRTGARRGARPRAHGRRGGPAESR